MPSSELPARPSLEQYRKQAKELLKRYKAGHADALSRVGQHGPHLRNVAKTSRPFALADAQWVLAREHGFQSWPKFVKHIEGAGQDNDRTAAALEPVQLQITTDEVNACIFLRDGKRVITAAQGDPVRMWDAFTGECLRAFDANSVQAWAVKALDDGRFVLIGCRDGAVRIVHTATGEIMQVLTGHRAFVRCVDVSPDLERAISGSGIRDHDLRLWDMKSERCIQLLEGHRDGVYAVAFDGRQQRALSGSRDTTVRVWDLASGQCLCVLEGHTYHVQSVAWATDGRRALSCSRDIRLWDVEAARCLRVFEGHTETIRSVAWSPDQRRALSASHDDTVRVWDVERGECLKVLVGHSVGVINAVWSANGRLAFSCDWSGEVRRWNVSAAAA
jgi:WD40 repeat protein